MRRSGIPSIKRKLCTYPLTATSTTILPVRALRAFHSSPSSTSSSPLSSISTSPIFFNKVTLLKEGSKPGSAQEEYETIPAFRVLDGEGKVLPGVTGEWKGKLEDLDKDVLVRLYKNMLELPSMVGRLCPCIEPSLRWEKREVLMRSGAFNEG